MRLTAICLLFAFTVVSGGCLTDNVIDNTDTTIHVSGLTDDDVAVHLGPEWEHIAAGVFERHDTKGSMSRIAVGRRGLEANLARFRAELDALDAWQDDIASTPEREEFVRLLRTRVADLEALSDRAQTEVSVTSNCLGDEFFAEVTLYQDYTGASAQASAGRGLGFGPPIPSQSYAYAGVFSGFWPIRARERYGDSTTPAWALIVTQNFYQCSLSTYAWVAPSCPEAYLFLEGHQSCEP